MTDESHNQDPGAYILNGKLFFKLRDGSTISCECIAEPYASQIAELFAAETKSVDALYRQGIKLGLTVGRYRQLFMQLTDAKQKRYEMNPERAAPPNRIETVNIEKEEYERWRKVCQIIDDATCKAEPDQMTPARLRQGYGGQASDRKMS